MDLQTAMYMNNDKAIAQVKASLLKIINQYFVQNDQAKALEKYLGALEPQNATNLTNSLDSVIGDLTKQLDQLLVSDKKVSSDKSHENVSKEGK